MSIIEIVVGIVEEGPAPAPPAPRRTLTLSVVAVLAGAAMLSLMGFQLALRLPGGQGIEDVLGWTHPEAVAAALAHWRGLTTLPDGAPAPERWHLESAYLLVDTWLFMPMYGVLLLLSARALRSALARDDGLPGRSPLGQALRRWFFAAACVAVALLLAVDAAENRGGAFRVGVPGAVFFGCLAAGAVFGIAAWLAATSDRREVRRAAGWALLAAFAIGAVLVGRAFFGALEAGGCAGLLPGQECHRWSAQAHQAKTMALLLAVGVVAGGWLLWLFGADRVPESALPAGAANDRAYRAALRSGIAAVVWRTRYVLVALAVYVGLILGLDQCRDVLLALGRWSPDASGIAGTPPAPGGQRAAMVVTIGLSVGLLVHSTWLWARLACRVRRQRDVGLRARQQAEGEPTLSAARRAEVADRLGVFARVWARTLSLVPLVCFYALVAFAISDATNAAAALSDGARLPPDLLLTVLILCLIGAVALGLGAVFLMWRRVLSLQHDADYFNQAEDLHRLLSGQDEGQRAPLPPAGDDPWSRLRLTFARLLRRLNDALPWVTPRTVPLAALGGLLLLRFGIAWQPATMSAIPPALAIVTLTLAWWMAVGGALTLVEVRHGRPYGLFVVAAIGILGMLPIGIADNHVLPIALPPAGEAALAAQRMHGMLLMAELAVAAGLLWWMLTADLSTWRLPRAWHGWVRSASVVVGLLACLLGLRLADRAELPPPLPTELAAARPVPSQVPTLDRAVRDWVAQLPALQAGDDGKVFLVASEGGGIRSAYWTARVLLTLREKYPDFDRRTFAMSGVSGGAVGIAAYSACLRAIGQPSAGGGVQACVDEGFAAVDPLSTLLAAWLFEDAFARALPVPMDPAGAKGWLRCSRPGCGYLSRALGFEREWMRALPALAQPLSAVGGEGGRWEPHLLLNGTWVESGEPAPVASVVVDPEVFPAARDVQARLGSELSLVGGAHVAARFPFVNPLAAVQPGSSAASSTLRGVPPADLPADGLDGHLGDGGYFDNSAVLSLMPVWRRVEAELREPHPARRLVVVLIRNGQKPPRCTWEDPKGPQRDCILPERKALSSAPDLAQPTQRRNWKLYADMLGPLVAVLNVSGIGAHGRYAPAALLAEAVQRDAAPTTTVMPIDQLDKGALVPLGWYLSPTAREALEAQAGCLRLELDGQPKDERPPHCR